MYGFTISVTRKVTPIFGYVTFSWGIIFSKDQFHDNCFKGNIRSITPCSDALIVLFV